MQTFMAIEPSAENRASYTAWVIYEIDTEGNITILEAHTINEKHKT